ncbi:MAG: ankyrin repeat domain-containing protein [Candidatus Thorarchaeota archaeon]
MRDIDRKLLDAVKNGDLDAVKQALEQGADINIKEEDFGDSPLHIACSNGDVAIAEYLLDNNADLLLMNRVDMTPLHLAARDGRASVVRLILSRAKEINERILNDVLHVASMSVYGTDEIVRMIDDFRTKQVRPSTDSLEDANALLLVASEDGDYAQATKALNEGADPNIQDGRGMRPLLWAALRGHLEIVESLLDNGANINGTNDADWTALMEASMEGHIEVVKLLLARGADVNAKTVVSGTALMFSSGTGHIEIVKLLLDHGADISIEISGTEDDDGMTALDYARRYGHPDIAELLMSRLS